MKKGLLCALLCACAMLCACSRAVPTWEYVTDSVLTQAPMEQVQYCVSFDVPSDAVLEEGAEGQSVYRQKDGDYEIVSRRIESSDPMSAIRTISGFAPEQLDVLHTTRYGLEECHFAWCSQTEQGTTVSRADAIFAAPYCYALVFSADEDDVARYAETQEQVFSSFSLFENEGF